MTITATIEYVQAISNRIARLTKIGGTVLDTSARKGDDVAAVGEIKGVYFVMYPDDTVDRFEQNVFVKYRQGWTGPVINDEASLTAARKEKERQAIAAAQAEKDRKRAERKAKKDNNSTQSSALIKQRYDIKIPENFVDTIDSVRPAFDFFFDKFGDGLTRRIGTSIREIENWSDPEYVLEAVMEKMHEYLGDPDDIPTEGPECTADDWLEFKGLDLKYQLALAYQYCGMLPR
jgi:uncharacterized small protein (DUF1192 family)